MRGGRPSWQQVLRPAAHAAIKSFFAARLDLALAIGFNSIAPGGLGLALSRGFRLLVAARVARSQLSTEQAEPAAEDGGTGSEDEGEAVQGVHSHSEELAVCSGRAGSVATAAASSSSRQPAHGVPNSTRCRGGPSGGHPKRSLGPLPKGLGTLPPLPLPPAPPGSLGACSTQPLGLPMMLVGQSAARAPMYASRGADRLVRGLLGLAASFLLCRAVRTPFTGRLARLPPRIVEWLFHSVVGPAAAVSYLSTSAAGQAAGRGDAALCRSATPELQQLYTRLRGAGQAEAARAGRSVVFAGKEAIVEAIPRSDINACCLPGGIVFVHSGLLKAVNGRQDSVAFVLGHEVGHAIGRHSLEKTASVYQSMFAVDAIVGLAERLLRGVAAKGPEEQDWVAGRLKSLDGLLQSGVYLLQLRQSRRHEYEADQLALALGAGAGLNQSALYSGARDVLGKFMKLEAGAGGGAVLPVGAPQGDSPLSTHPAAVNRLQRLTQVAQGRA